MRQILGEVYPDVVEQYHDKVITTAGGETFPQLDELYHSKYKKYLRSVIRQIRESNDDFRWLSCVPYKDEKGKIKDYVYVNIKASTQEGEELLSEVNEFWLKHIQATYDGLQNMIDLLRYT